ncbi:MAG: hypothetical protein JXR95_14385 [Deltaproteobacteria bacterium]|nr:hypothetical protein [Deltaproteobacteria bacterium]
MKKLSLITAVIVSTLFYSGAASSQVLIIIEDDPGYRAPEKKPCPPPPVVRRVRRVAPPVEVQAPIYPAVPSNLANQSANNYSNNSWALGIFRAASASDDPYEGGGVFLQYMFDHKIGLEGSVYGLAGNYDYDYYKESTRVTLSGLYFLGSGAKQTGVSWYLKGGLLWNTVTEYSDYDYYEYSDSTTHFEGGIGFQWRIFGGWLSLGMESTLSIPMDEDGEDDTLKMSASPSLNFRFFTAIHF